MGNTNSNKCELTEYGNVCEMTQCLTSNVVGLSANSASPTDTWVVEFKDGTTHENNPIKNAFLKMWISNETLKNLKSSKGDDFKELMLKVSGLNYEVAVYRDILKLLIETNICPNFVKFLGASKNCMYTNIVEMSIGRVGMFLEKKDIQERLDTVYGTSVALAQPNSKLKRLKITEKYSDKTLKIFEQGVPRKLVEEKFKYNIMANEVIKPGTVSLSQFLKNPENNSVKSKVIFQALAACYAMSCSKMCHNDLHLGNVYVEHLTETTKETSQVRPRKKSVRMNYIYEGDLYTFETNYIAKVFDFDRSYVQRFGNNPMLTPPNEEWICGEYSQCNKYIENLDALKLMSGIYDKLRKD